MRVGPVLMLASLVVLAACEERSLGVGESGRLSLVLQVSSSGAGRAVEFHAFYLNGETPRTILLQTTDLSSATQSVALRLDIGQCLADAKAQATPCEVIIDVRLLDASGSPLDTARVGPVGMTAGATIQQTVTLREVATVAVQLRSGLFVGDTARAIADVRDRVGTVLAGRRIDWSSSNAAVASVDATGLVTALAAGSAVISASSQGIVGQASVAVTAVPVASVTVSLQNPSVIVGQSTQGTATTRDASGKVLTGRTITWSSSNTAVATVNATTGLVTSVSVGSANIIATSEGVTGQALLTVTPIPVASVTVSLTLSTLSSPNQTSQATAITRDANGNVLTGRVITWSSSNAAVASVNPASGLVAAVGPGTATISATSEGKTGGATITVVGATVSILSATIAGTQVPVNVAAVAAGIDVSIGMTSGAQLIDSLLLRIDNTRAAAISFGTSGPPSSVVLSVNTASFNASHIPSWTNGQHSMHADLYPRGSSSPTVSNPMFLTLVNPDVVYFNPAGLVHTGTCSPTFPTVCAGGFTVSSFPVNYSGAISSITYFFNVCGAGAGVTAPNFTATIPCAFISDSGNNAVQQINVRYPAGYTQTVAPRLFMTSASPGFVPGQPQWTPTNYDTDEDNVPPTVVRVPAVVAVTVFPRSITLNQGSSVQLTARVSTSGQPTVTVTYSSSDPSVASVSASGLVTALSSATAAIEVTACSSINQCVAQITLVTVN